MNLDDLRTFTRVAELGSLSAVAREQDAPVSQISRAITRLECLHQVRLLHRSTHSLSFTEAGQSLLAHGRLMLEQLSAYEEEVSPSGEASGTVRIAASPAMAQYVIVPALPQLHRLHPHLSIDVQADDRLIDMAQQGIDLAIRTGEPGSENFVARKIGEHGRSLYAAPSYIAEFGSPQHMDDLAQHRLIANSAQPQLNRWPFKVDGKPVTLQARGFYKTNSSSSMLSMALAGLGILRANTVFCDPLVRSGQLVHILEHQTDHQRLPVHAVMLKDRHRAKKVRACVEFFATVFAMG